MDTASSTLYLITVVKRNSRVTVAIKRLYVTMRRAKHARVAWDFFDDRISLAAIARKFPRKLREKSKRRAKTTLTHSMRQEIQYMSRN